MNDLYSELYHHGIKGQKWGVRRYQNPDGSLTAEGLALRAKSGGDTNDQDISYEQAFSSRQAVNGQSNDAKQRAKTFAIAGASILAAAIAIHGLKKLGPIIKNYKATHIKGQPINIIELLNGNDSSGKYGITHIKQVLKDQGKTLASQVKANNGVLMWLMNNINFQATIMNFENSI